jgi:hypothetical protein
LKLDVARALPAEHFNHRGGTIGGQCPPYIFRAVTSIPASVPEFKMHTNRILSVFLFSALCVASSLAVARADDVTISDPAFDAKKGVWQYTVSSPYQKGPNAVEVLLPDDFQKSRKYRVTDGALRVWERAGE